MSKLTEKDIKQILEGFEGEGVIRDYLKSKKLNFFQVDLMVKLRNKWHLIEVKHQEAFDPPPFKGHGLPKWQIEARLKFQEETGIRAMLFIVDKGTNLIYWNYLDDLMKGQYHETNGRSPRVIFPITNYKLLQ
jgi:hypothetical protein